MSTFRIVALCPGGVTTGGPEVLHQLVDCLRANSIDAYVSYYPFNKEFSVPAQYKKYNTPQAHFQDTSDTIFVLPETATRFIKLIKNGQVCIWWLSVDYYFGALRESVVSDLIARFRTLRRQRLPLFLLKKHRHFYQSFYARDFLSSKGIHANEISDYLNDAHAATSGATVERENIVIFNPRKGKRRTEVLIKGNPDINFVPIQGMNPDQVAQLMCRAKVYIDLGHHPGKDRLPREAAIAGCCVVTNRRGAAAFYEDVPISNIYKLDDSKPNYVGDFGKLANSIFAEFNAHSENFVEYRNKILAERSRFEGQVLRSFGLTASTL